MASHFIRFLGQTSAWSGRKEDLQVLDQAYPCEPDAPKCARTIRAADDQLWQIPRRDARGSPCWVAGPTPIWAAEGLLRARRDRLFQGSLDGISTTTLSE